MHEASRGVAATCALPDRDCERSKDLGLLTQVAAFDFVHAAPDAVHLTGAKRMVETLRHDRACSADLLRAGLSVIALVLGFHANRRKESLGERALAFCLSLPSKPGTPLFFFAAKRHCPLQIPKATLRQVVGQNKGQK